MTVRHADPPASATTMRHSNEKLPPTVLVVDDTTEVRAFVSFLLRASGYRVIEAENGLAAQALIAHEHPALVITDLEMPVCDGWSVLTYCRAQQPNTPVLIMSGVALGRRLDIECLAAGFLAKPLDLARFRAEVHRLVGRTAQPQPVRHVPPAPLLTRRSA